MTPFLLNVLASILAGFLVLLVAAALSHRARWLLTGLLARLLDVDIDYVFPNKKASDADIEAELHRSRTVAVIMGRGNELQRDSFAPLLVNRTDSGPVAVRVLLPLCPTPAGQYDWTRQRELELASFDPSYGHGLLAQIIDVNVRFCQDHAAANRLALRRFNSPHIGRIVITDRYVYYSPYLADSHGRFSKVYKFRRGGEMYDNLSRLFEQLWTAGEGTEQLSTGSSRSSHPSSS